MTFAQHLKMQGISGIRVFGDSITTGLNASQPHLSWPALFAAEVGGLPLHNLAIPGTLLQGSPFADGNERPGNGVGRFSEALLASSHRDAILILYGYNDARYTASSDTVNVANFGADYARILDRLIEAGHAQRLAIGSPPYIPEAGLSVGSPGFHGQTREGFEAYVQSVQALAERFGIFYAPVYEQMKAHGDGELSSPDITHPNDLGHRVICDVFCNALRP
ncbi:lysophospholipase [Rhizobium sp. Root1203]|uniref:SGNH/GDSL hydrolase family protein n=1 Tax=Rhizobium sp. Root1203 TaxID=1736427 RepID=UPI00070DBAED|nr:GDSL-type esterase/lipase family protein [Rhizobium sp. Root1203]KQV30285.1 lysophospholipase [Rhizobium sp. Root1203]